MNSLNQNEIDTEIKIKNTQEKIKAYSSDEYSTGLKEANKVVDYDTKQEILKKYIKDIVIEFDKPNKYYSIMIHFNISDLEPIEYIYQRGTDYVHQYPTNENTEVIYFGDKKEFNIRFLIKKDLE